MPTGYTAELTKMKYDVRRWLKESAIRAMGVCVTLRDSGSMSESEISERLRDEPDDYHAKKFKEAVDELKRVAALDDITWRQEFRKKTDEAKTAYTARLKEFNEGKEAHIKAIREVETLLGAAVSNGAGEVITGTLRFAKEQLTQSLRFDFGSGPYREDVLDWTLQKFKEQTISKLEWDRDYHAKEGAKSKERKMDRSAEYEKFVKFVDETRVT